MTNDSKINQNFRTKLLEHYQHPHNVGTIANPDFCVTEHNHLCGDHIKIEGRIKGDLLVEVRFVASGCMLSQACASIISDDCKNKSITQILGLNAHYVQDLIEMSLGPTRLRCALLPLQALQRGIKVFLNSKPGQ